MKLFFSLLVFIFISYNQAYSQTLQDSTTNQNRISNFNNQNKFADQKQNEFLLETEIEQQKLFRNLFFIGFVFLLVFIIVLIFSYRSKVKRISRIIEFQKAQQNSHNLQIMIFSMVLNQVENSVVIASSTGEIQWYNESFVNLFNYSQEKDKNKSIFSIPEKTDNTKFNNAMKTLLEEKNLTSYDDKFIDSLGKEISFMRKVIPIMDNHNGLVNVIVIDIAKKN
jgi:PAS domain S-box-containing protein